MKPSEGKKRRIATEPPGPVAWVDRWYGKLSLIAMSVISFPLAFAPVGIFPLAWVGLVPWLILVFRSRSQKAVFGWSWIAGFLFFITNMWWLAYVTVPGMFALMMILALQWSWAGLIIRGSGLIHGTKYLPLRVFGIAGIWVATEWFRGRFPWDGLPWIYIGHTQSPALPLCQVVDVLGVAGVSFWVVCINAVVAMLVIHRNFRRCAGAVITVVVMMIGLTLYGAFRMGQDTTRPGPKVMVVQSSYPQSNTGDKGAPSDVILDFHLRTTRLKLIETGDVDLVVWSETMMPPINRSARERARAFKTGEVWLDAHKQLMSLAYEFNTAMLVGGHYYDGWEKFDAHDMRNTAYFYEAGGLPSDLRYDKIHLVPFGEFVPFKKTAPALFNFFMKFTPYDGFDYSLTPGDREALTVFPVKDFRVVSPICFEDLDAWLVAKMFRSDKGKRADLIVNLTNDGWFKANEMPMHLQAAIFRSIENRAPTARSVNTGISGFIDSVGRVHDALGVGVEGASVAQVQVDSRYTLFTRFGEWFAWLCAIWTSVLAVGAIVKWRMTRREAK